MFQSIGLASDAVAMQGRAQFEEHDDYIVVRTPDEPTYWHGNMIIRKTPPGNLRAQVADFETAFPEATHRTIVWDVPGLDPNPISTALSFSGYKVETFDVLALKGALPFAPAPNSVVMRPVTSKADWADLLDLQLEIAVEEGYERRRHEPFLIRRNITRREQIASGLGQWFAAFDRHQLVASMGLFYDAHIARYQSVETRASHRRRGICSALLRHVGLWALDRAPDATLVIVAEADSDAGRLYRRMGFDLVETLVEASKPGY